MNRAGYGVRYPRRRVANEDKLPRHTTAPELIFHHPICDGDNTEQGVALMAPSKRPARPPSLLNGQHPGYFPRSLCHVLYMEPQPDTHSR